MPTTGGMLGLRRAAGFGVAGTGSVASAAFFDLADCALTRTTVDGSVAVDFVGDSLADAFFVALFLLGAAFFFSGSIAFVMCKIFLAPR